MSQWHLLVSVIILRKLRAFRTLGTEGRREVLETLTLTVLVSAGFRVVGVARTQEWLRRWASAGKCEPQLQNLHSEILSSSRAQHIVRRNTGIKGTCLVRSLTLWAILLRRGLKTDLRVGFRRREGKLEGHAWVEYEGTPLNEERDITRTYSVFSEPAAFDASLRPDRWL